MAILLESDKATAGTLLGVIGADAQVVDTLAAAKAALSEGKHDLVVVGPDVEAQAAFDLAASQRVTCPALGVVLMRRRIHSALLRDAMVAGVREVVADDDLAALVEACRRSRQLSRQVQQEQGGPGSSAESAGQVVTVFAAKGGCGKTTVATNLAASLAGLGRRVCLVDLDLAFGDVAITMQLTPTRTVAGALGLSSLDEIAVRSLVTPHSPGLDTILAPVEPGTAESIPSAVVGELLQVLRSEYDVVVVDSPPAFTDHVLAAFDVTDHFVLLTTLDIPALKNLKLTLETLDMLNYPADRRHVVLNRADAKVGLSLDDVERALRTKVAAQLPSSRAVPASVNRGVPIVLDQPTHSVSLAVRRFAEQTLLPEEHAARRQPRRGLRLRRKVEVTA